MGGKTGLSLFCLLGPFFTLWALFWLVPLGMGIDLSIQSPDFRPVYRDAVLPEDSPPASSLTFLDWRNPKEEVREDVPRYVGLENFKKAIDDSKFHKALSNTLILCFGFDHHHFASGLCLGRQPTQFGKGYARGFGFLADDSWFGFARCPFDFVLSFLSWPNGCVEPVSCDPAWFRSGELDDGSGFHYAFLDYASGLALDRLGDPVLPLRLGGDSPMAIRGGPGRGSRCVDADAFDIVSRCSTPSRFCRGVFRGGWFCGLFRSLQPPRRFGRNS